jgi:hypothetical protein
METRKSPLRSSDDKRNEVPGGARRELPLSPLTGPAPVSTSQSRHLARIVLATWTGILLVLVASAIRSIPPVVLAFLLPYLALVAWHLLAPPGWPKAEPLPAPAGLEDAPLAGSGTEGSATPPPVSFDAGDESPGPRETSPSPTSIGEPPSITPAPARMRRRVRPRVVPDLPPASWVQVGPGRFIRGEQPDPVPDPIPDASGEGRSETDPSEALAGLAPDGPSVEGWPDDTQSHESAINDRDGPAGGQDMERVSDVRQLGVLED